MYKPLIPQLILIQALIKNSSLEWIIQKGTEIGVSQFYFYPSALSIKQKLSSIQIQRYQRILISSLKQCNRLDLPAIKLGFPLLNIPLFFGDLNEEAPLLSQKTQLPAALVIGPEKGFTKKEIEELKTKGQGVRLAPYILRAETAAITGLSLLANSPITTIS